MDKRLAYIMVGLLVILYLVSQKDHPELWRDLRGKTAAIWNGKFGGKSAAVNEANEWERHRQEVFASRVADSKRRAIAKYPSLAMADSEMNVRFVFRYKWMTKESDERLHNYNWPELLADDCAAATHPGGSSGNTKVAAVVSKPGKQGTRPADVAVR